MRTWVGIMVASLALSFLSILSPLLTRTSYAAGEVFTWADVDTINAKGGSVGAGDFAFPNPIPFTLGTPPAGSPTIPGHEYFLGLPIVLNSVRCTLVGAYIGLISPTSGALRVPAQSTQTVISDPAAPPLCTDAVAASFDNKVYAIGGTRPAVDPDAETAAQRRVAITILTDGPYDSQPATIQGTIILNNIDGTPVLTVTFNKAGFDRTSPDVVVYNTAFQLDPGNYSCLTPVLNCYPSFTKVKGTPLNLTFGSPTATQVVNVHIRASFANSTGPEFLPSMDITLVRPDGTIFQTQASQAQGGPPGSDGDLLLTTDVVFTGVPLGNYKVCTPAPSSVCKDFVKGASTVSVTLDIVGATADAPGAPAPVVPTCANTGNGSAVLRWILCPVVETLDGSIHWLDTKIQSLLVVRDPSNTDSFGAGSGTSEALHEAWGRVRNIALIVLIPIMLVMVIGTAMGVSFLDAYTVRRAMPRFLIAIVFISLSWYITAFLINLTNAVGTGILGLMTQPFGGPDADLSSLITTAGGVGLSAGALTGFAIFGGLIIAGAVSFGIILSYAFIALLVLFIGFVLLTIRQLLILTLVLFAPLAILSWIFPNNDKLWKLWWGTFSRLLLMFPLIMILIGAGKIFAWVIAHTQ